MSLFFLQSHQLTDNTGSYTVTSSNFGTASSDRYIVLVVDAMGTSNGLSLSSSTIGGVSSTVLYSNYVNDGGNAVVASILAANIPTGTSGNIVLNYSGSMTRCGIGVYSLSGIDSITPYDSTSSTTNPFSVTIDVPANGYVIGGGNCGGGSAVDWTGLTKNYVDRIEFAIASNGASGTFNSAQTGLAITATQVSGTVVNMAIMSWSPASYPGSIAKITKSAVNVADGNKSWSNLTNMTLDDTSESSCTALAGAGDITDSIKCTNFGFNIPVTATIDGIELIYKIRSNSNDDMIRQQPFLVIGGTKSATNGATTYGSVLSTSSTVYTEGSPTDKWVNGGGSAPTVSQINDNTGFGVQINFLDDGAGAGDSVWITNLFLKVYYTDVTGGGGSSTAHTMMFSF